MINFIIIFLIVTIIILLLCSIYSFEGFEEDIRYNIITDWVSNLNASKSFINTYNRLPQLSNNTTPSPITQQITTSIFHENELYYFLLKQTQNYIEFLDYNYTSDFNTEDIFFIKYIDLRNLWEEFFNNNLEIFNLDLLSYEFFNSNYITEWTENLNNVRNFINCNKRAPTHESVDVNETNWGNWLRNAVKDYRLYGLNMIDGNNYFKNPEIRQIFIDFLNSKISTNDCTLVIGKS